AGTYLGKDSLLQSVIDKHDIDHPSQELVDKYMAAGGFTKGADGFWGKDGKALEFKVRVPAFIQPIQAPLTQQLKDAGFNAIQAPDHHAWRRDSLTGKCSTQCVL